MFAPMGATVRRAGRESRCARAPPPHGGAPPLAPRRPRRGAQLAVAGAVQVSTPTPGPAGPPRPNLDAQMWVTTLGGWDASGTVCPSSVAFAGRPGCVETFFLGDVFGRTVFVGLPLVAGQAAREAPRFSRHSDLIFIRFVPNPAGQPPIACPGGRCQCPAPPPARRAGAGAHAVWHLRNAKGSETLAVEKNAAVLARTGAIVRVNAWRKCFV